MALPKSPREMKKIDLISYRLYKDYIEPVVGRSRKKVMTLKNEIHGGPPIMGKSTNLTIRKILKDGRGMDGMNAAMMTFGYLEAILQYQSQHLLELSIRRKKLRLTAAK